MKISVDILYEESLHAVHVIKLQYYLLYSIWTIFILRVFKFNLCHNIFYIP